MVTIIFMIIKMIINVRIIMIIKISDCDLPHLPLLPCCLLILISMMMILLIEIFDFLHLLLITLQSTGGQC